MADLCYLCQTNFLILSPHCYPSLAWEAVSSPRFWPNGSVVRNKGITQCRPVMRTLIAQAGEPGGTAPPTTNGGNREKCILRPAISWSFPTPTSVRVLPHTYITRRKCAAPYVQSKLRRPRRRPSFFPAICARIYGRTFVCRPQYMGDVIIVIRGLPPRRTGIGARRTSDRFRHLGQSKTF